MNPLFTEIAASQATSVVGGYTQSTGSTTYSNQATLQANADVSTEQENGTFFSNVTGSVNQNDTSASTQLTISTGTYYN